MIRGALLILYASSLFAADLTVYRPKFMGASGFQWPIFIDGKHVGSLKLGEKLALKVTSGRHGIRFSEKPSQSILVNIEIEATVRLDGNGLLEVFGGDPAVAKELGQCVEAQPTAKVVSGL